MIAILKAFILPPGMIICGISLALILALTQRKYLTRLVLLMTLLFTFFISTPYGANILLKPTYYPAISQDVLDQLQKEEDYVIVVLGGGRRASTIEFQGEDVPNRTTLLRLNYAAYLYRQTGFPILLSGGKDDLLPGHPSEAEIMQQALNNQFKVPVKYLERKSRDTQENAQFSAAILDEMGTDHILLVTSAWHMSRAVRAFEGEYLSVIAAPTDFVNFDVYAGRYAWLPSLYALTQSYFGLYEGLVWLRDSILQKS